MTTRRNSHSQGLTLEQLIAETKAGPTHKQREWEYVIEQARKLLYRVTT